MTCSQTRVRSAGCCEATTVSCTLHPSLLITTQTLSRYLLAFTHLPFVSLSLCSFRIFLSLCFKALPLSSFISVLSPFSSVLVFLCLSLFQFLCPLALFIHSFSVLPHFLHLCSLALPSFPFLSALSHFPFFLFSDAHLSLSPCSFISLCVSF